MSSGEYRLNPFHPPRFWFHLGRAYFVAHRYQDAIEAFKHINTPDQTQHAFMAASYAYLDDDTQAAAHGRQVLSCAPDFTVPTW